MKISRQTVFYNTLVQFIGKFAFFFLSYFVLTLILPILGPTGYGEYTLVFIYLGFFAVFADFGIQLSVLADLSRQKSGWTKVFANLFSLRVFLILTAMMLSAGLVFFLPYSTTVKWGILLGALGYLFLLPSNVFGALFQARLRIDLSVFAEVLGKMLTVLLVMVLVWRTSGFEPNLILLLVGAVVVGNFLTLAVSGWLARRYTRHFWSLDLSGWGKLFRVGAPLGLVFLLGTLHFKQDSLLLSFLKPSEEVGIYGLAYKIFELVLLFPGMFLASLYPVLARCQNRLDDFRSVTQKGFDLLLILALPLTIMFLFGSGEVLKLFRGEEFLGGRVRGIEVGNLFLGGSDIALSLLALSWPAIFVSQLFIHLLILAVKQKMLVLTTALTLFVNLTLNLFLIPAFSYLAASFLTVLTETLSMLINWVLIRRYTAFRPSFSVLLRLLPAVIAMALTLVATRDWPILLSFVLAGLAYGTSLFWFLDIRGYLVLLTDKNDKK